MNRLALTSASLLGFALLTGCAGDKGAAGPPGAAGAPGTPGSPGARGSSGEPGAAGANAPPSITQIALPGDDFFPEGIASAQDGTLFVGSLSTGGIVRIRTGEKAQVFVNPEQFVSTIGLAVDDANNRLYVCYADLSMQSANGLAAVDLTTGEVEQRYDFPAGGACNDIAVDDDGDVYATDTFLNVIRRLPADADALEEWVSDPRFASAPQSFGLNGIGWTGTDVYVVNSTLQKLFRITVSGDGTAGEVTEITTNKPIGTADGLKVLDSGTLALVDGGSGSVKQVMLDGDTGAVQTVRNGLDSPTTLALAFGDAWVVEGQLPIFLNGGAMSPHLPFLVQRVTLPAHP